MANKLDWYRSQAGIDSYSQQDTLEKRTVFFHDFLNNVVSQSFIESGILFKIAFFFADGVTASTLPCADYPDIVDVSKNRFLDYLIKGKYFSDEILYHILMAILHGIVNPADNNAWIYDDEILKSGGYTKILDDTMHNYQDEMPFYSAFIVKPGCEFLQLQLVWLFAKEGKI